MTVRTRQAALDALFAILVGAYAWTTPPERTKKFVLWNDSPKSGRPAAYQFEGGDETYVWTQGAVPKRVIPVYLFVYVDATLAEQSPVLNAIMDALDAALAPNPVTGLQALGDTCVYCRIVGPVLKVPGDIDGDGMLHVPIQITL